jgi:hypothetical protein
MRIPPEVAVFLSRGRGGRKRLRRACFPTDVIEARKNARHTGIEMDGGAQTFTGGTLVNWNDPQDGPCWGLLSVSHAVASEQVRIQPPGKAAFYGTVYARTTLQDSFDAVLIKLKAADVQASLGNFLPTPGSPAPICRSVEDLFDDGRNLHPTGKSLTVDSVRDFTIYGYFPAEQAPDAIIDDAPNREHLVVALGENQTFESGTSGSVWKADSGVVDAIQIAGFPDTFARGIGQPMVDYLSWAALQTGVPVSLVSVF